MARNKRMSSANNSSDDDVNLTPMLDVVFILLIFFIVTAQFIREPGVDVDRLTVDNLNRQNPLGILIAIDENSKIFMNKEEITLAEVGFNIRELRQDNPKGRLVLQADDEADAGVLIDVLEIINKEDGLTSIPVSALKDG